MRGLREPLKLNREREGRGHVGQWQSFSRSVSVFFVHQLGRSSDYTIVDLWHDRGGEFIYRYRKENETKRCL